MNAPKRCSVPEEASKCVLISESFSILKKCAKSLSWTFPYKEKILRRFGTSFLEDRAKVKNFLRLSNYLAIKFVNLGGWIYEETLFKLKFGKAQLLLGVIKERQIGLHIFSIHHKIKRSLTFIAHELWESLNGRSLELPI